MSSDCAVTSVGDSDGVPSTTNTAPIAQDCRPSAAPPTSPLQIQETQPRTSPMVRTVPSAQFSLTSMITQTDRLRNFCMLAHVDHGKTTLSDSLIASNGIISTSMAGKLRFMDSREDEQERQITMKVSSILLKYQLEGKPYLLNLLDSPGHIDFSGEVSTAVRLCDGGLLCVDAVDGVGCQTQVVLQQAYREGISLCLIINKIDLLFAKLKQSPEEAYLQLRTILASVNVAYSSLINADAIQRRGVTPADGATAATDDADNQGQDDLFWPLKGNVVFASALHGWAFTTADFARIWAAKLKCNEKALAQALWGEYYFDRPKGGGPPRVVRKPVKANQPPMFVQFCLQPIWDVYAAFYEGTVQANECAAAAASNAHPSSLAGKQTNLQNNSQSSVAADAAGGVDKRSVILERLGITVRPTDLRSRDPEVVTKAVMNAWIPLSEAVMKMVVSQFEPPTRCQAPRLPGLFPDLYHGSGTGDAQTDALLKTALEKCDRSGNTVVAYIGKMFEVDSVGIVLPPEATAGDGASPAAKIEDGKKGQLLAFCRVFCGTLRKGQSLYVLGPRHGPAQSSASRRIISKTFTKTGVVTSDPAVAGQCEQVILGQLFLHEGRGVLSVDSVPAGMICSISGLQEHVLKTATLVSDPKIPPCRALEAPAAPVVQFVVSPKNPADLHRLHAGLQLLHRADPQVESQVRGVEVVVRTAGQVHAQRCLKDLEEVFARVSLDISEPIVSLKETVVTDELVSKKEIARRRIILFTPGKQCRVAIRCVPVPDLIHDFLTNHRPELESLCIFGIPSSSSGSSPADEKSDEDKHAEETLAGLLEAFQKVGMEDPDIPAQYRTSSHRHHHKGWANELRRLWSLGPGNCGSCLLLNHCQRFLKSSLFRPLPDRLRQSPPLPTCPDPSDVIAPSSVSAGDLATEKDVDDASSSNARGGGGGSARVTSNVSIDSPRSSVGSAPNKQQDQQPLTKSPVAAVRSISPTPAAKATSSPHVPPRAISPTPGSAHAGVSSDSIISGGGNSSTLRSTSRLTGSNVLTSPLPSSAALGAEGGAEYGMSMDTESVQDELTEKWKDQMFRDACEYINQGFQHATEAGPMCGEPMSGVAFIVEEIEFYQTQQQATAAFSHYAVKTLREKLNIPANRELTDEQTAAIEAEVKVATEQVAGSFGRHGPLGAQIITMVSKACSDAFALQPRRVIEPIYKCQVVVRGDLSGKVYAALQKKRAEVTDDLVREGTDMHLIEAEMPVVESFGFAEELWTRTAGAATAQLRFSCWRVLAEDPYWEPRTEDEKEEFGQVENKKAQPLNVAARLIERVRKQKGIYIAQPLVQEGEKIKYSVSAA